MNRMESDSSGSRKRSAANLRDIGLIAMAVAAMATSGCRSMRAEDNEGIFAFRDVLSVQGIRGPLERALQREEDSLAQGQKFTAEGRREVDAARKLFEDADYRKAAKAYGKIAKKYRESGIGEEAQFRMGECYFALNEYAKAQDAYDQLFEENPSTGYVEPATRRMFTIAREWLEIADPVAAQEIRTVSHEEVVDDGKPPVPSRDPTLKYRILPNFHNKTRPTFDTQGRALAALKSIWLNDPTGPLADDALMLTASYHLRRGNNIEADRYFEILRDEYSDSPHLEDAFVLGSHVRLMSYQGPYYDKTSLVAAEKLKEQTLNLFPDSEARQQLRSDLQRIYLQKAQRAWERVSYYQKKDNPRAVAVACIQVINEYPDTRFAEAARKQLARIDRRHTKGLPEIAEVLESLPRPAQPTDVPASNLNSVRDSQDSSGRVRL